MVLKDQLEYAWAEATLQQKLCKIEAANEKACIDAKATKQAEIDKLNMINEKARIYMQSWKQAVTAMLKLA